MTRPIFAALLAVSTWGTGCISLDFLWFYPERLEEYTHEWTPPEGSDDTAHAPNHVPEECIEEVALTTEDGLTVYGLWAWNDPEYLAGDTSMACGTRRASRTIAYSHGQSYHLDHYWDRVQLLWDLGFNVFAVDYRGYGKSEGDPTEAGIYEDGRTALTHVRCRLSDLDPCDEDTALPSARGQKLIYYGYSLGSTVAVQIATEVTPAALILESSLASAQAFVDDSLQLGVPASALLEYQFDNVGKIPSITSPKLFLHGSDDDYVRFYFSQLLYEESSDECLGVTSDEQVCKELWKVTGAGHGDIPEVSGDGYGEHLLAFIDPWVAE